MIWKRRNEISAFRPSLPDSNEVNVLLSLASPIELYEVMIEAKGEKFNMALGIKIGVVSDFFVRLRDLLGKAERGCWLVGKVASCHQG